MDALTVGYWCNSDVMPTDDSAIGGVADGNSETYTDISFLLTLGVYSPPPSFTTMGKGPWDALLFVTLIPNGNYTITYALNIGNIQLGREESAGRERSEAERIQANGGSRLGTPTED